MKIKNSKFHRIAYVDQGKGRKKENTRGRPLRTKLGREMAQLRAGRRERARVQAMRNASNMIGRRSHGVDNIVPSRSITFTRLSREAILFRGEPRYNIDPRARFLPQLLVNFSSL